jgi:glycosyltransferase involved in cell wall biosynthesis
MPTVMSVFGVEPFRIGGTETFARELSSQLDQQGWDSVLCFQSEPPDDVRRFLNLDNVSFEVLPDSPNVNFKAIKDFIRVVRRHRPEIVHLHFTGFLGPYPWLARLNSVKKVFFTDHTSRPAGYIARRAPWWKRMLARAINLPLTKIVCVSRYGYQCLNALDLVPGERCELVYNGVDLSRVQPNAERAAEFRRRYSIPTARTVVLQVSWIIPEKGIPDLLKAARLVISKNPHVQFVFVGEGAYRQQYTKEAETMGLGDHVTWTGLVEDPFGEGVYDVADIICQASNWEEVFGWMIAEGMAYAKPVVGTRVGGIPELVADQQSGFVVERGDAGAVAERILDLASNPDLRARMGLRGCELVATHFDLRVNVAKLIDLYRLQSSDDGPASADDRRSEFKP